MSEIIDLKQRLGLQGQQRKSSGTSRANSAHTNLPDNPRNPHDFYRTPAWAVTELYRALPWTFPEPTLDPCAGDGALIDAYASLDRRGRVRGVEFSPVICGQAWERGHWPAEEEDDRPHVAGVIQGDGLELDWTGEHILMNPPYNNAEAWAAKASTAASCCMLVRTGFLHSKRRHPLWRRTPPDALVFLASRPSFVASGRNDSADYVWVVWSHSTPWSQIGTGNALFWITKPT